MSWDYFLWFAFVAMGCWLAGAVVAWRQKSPWVSLVLTGTGLVVFFAFILGLWISLERPPMRTMGETRLWYSFFLPLVGLITYVRWKYKWILMFSFILACVFICINLFKPEIHNKTLMPALQSPWFAPHVIVYMFAYAMLGAAVVMAVYLLWIKRGEADCREMELTDNLVYVGLAFMTLGMLFGALWAKEAWGHYWSWDPKETWGCRYVAGLSGVYSFPASSSGFLSPGIGGYARLFRVIADVLVRHQLSACCTGRECAYL